MVICRRAERHTGPAVVLTSRGSTRDADKITDHSRGWRRIAIPGDRPRPLLELVVIAVMFGAYKLGRIVAAKHVGTAFDNAYVVWDLERLLRLPDELSVQALMLHSAVVVKIANVYYAAVHFPATAAFLVWLYLRRPEDYLWIRRTLALLTASGLLVHLAIPVAPPRMLSTLGFVDTAAVYGPAVYGPPARNTLADQYAAMPSLHIGWAVMVALGIIATTRSRWRWLAVLHPVVTTLVVIGTANHFWLDGMVAAGLLAAALVVVRSVGEPRVDVPDFVPVLAVRPLPAAAGRAVAGRAVAGRADLAVPRVSGAIPSRVGPLGLENLPDRRSRRVASPAGSAGRPERSRRVLNPVVLLGMPLGIVLPVVLDLRAPDADPPGSAAAAEDLADVAGDRRDR